MNYLIVTLSKINETIAADSFTSIAYSTETGSCFTGKQTNEAPTKYVIHELAESGELLDKIIVLVSDECLTVPIPAINGMVTYDYYRESIGSYLEDIISETPSLHKIIDRDYGNRTDDYIRTVFRPVNITDDLLRSIVDIICEENSPSKDSLYLDFTGGSRVTSLISLLLARILESTNTEVKRIIYGDIMKSSHHAYIHDCTQPYNLLAVIEDIAKAQGNDGERNRKIIEALKKLGLIEKENASDIEELDHLEAEAERGVKKQPAEEEQVLERIISKQSGLSKRLAVQSRTKTEEIRAVSRFTRLLAKSARDKIKDFYESILDLLIDEGVLCGSDPKQEKDDIKNALRANNAYYYGSENAYGKRMTNGLIRTVQQWCRMLKNAEAYGKAADPQRSFQIYGCITNRFFEEKWRPPRYPKSINIDKVNFFVSFLKENGLIIPNGPPTETFIKMSRYEILFYNYGFPFMCTGVGKDDSVYPEIYEFYHDIIKDFSASLSQLKQEDPVLYSEKLDAYINDKGALEDDIPYMIKMSACTVSNDFFDTQKDRESFIQELYTRLERARPYRNAIAHNSDNSFSDPRKQESIAAEIDSWVKEYEALVHTGKGKNQ